MPQVTRDRRSQERKRDKPQEKQRQRKRVKTTSKQPNLLASTLLSIGKALEEHTRWGKRKRASVAQEEAVDKEVLSEVFSKLGLETKIDQIEAEFNAEAKAARVAARNKLETTVTNDTVDNTPEKPPPTHFDIAYGAPNAHAQHRKYWTAAVCVLGVLLVIQSVFLFRDRIARTFPGTRPALISLCNTFGCAMPLPRLASKINIQYNFNEWEDRREQDKRYYLLYAKVTNNATFEQDWPSLELTLFNSIQQVFSRRIFEPAEWVPREKFAQNTGMAPRSSVEIHLEQEVTEIDPNNVRLVPANAILTHSYP